MEALSHPQFTLFGADPRSPEERRRDLLEDHKRNLEGQLYELGEDRDALQEQLADLDVQAADVTAQLTALQDALDRLHRPDLTWQGHAGADAERSGVPA